MIINRFKLFAQDVPAIYFNLGLVSASIRRLRAYGDGELVIESFPRSGNTTTVYSFVYAQQRSVKIGHHLHVPAHVRFAVKKSIPCIIIIREPLDCVASLILYKGLSPAGASACIAKYISFYTTVRELSESLVVVNFKQIVDEGVGFAVEAINAKYGTDFVIPEGSQQERKWVEEQERKWNLKNDAGSIDKIALPSAERAVKAARLRKWIRINCATALATAERLYSRFDTES